jgi:hypothetical protein
LDSENITTIDGVVRTYSLEPDELPQVLCLGFPT